MELTPTEFCGQISKCPKMLSLALDWDAWLIGYTLRLLSHAAAQ